MRIVGNLSYIKRYQTPQPQGKHGLGIPSVQRCQGGAHTWHHQPQGHLHQGDEGKNHHHNLRDSIMVSLQAFLRYHHNVPSHIISSDKILPYYYIRWQKNVPEELEHQLGINQTV